MPRRIFFVISLVCLLPMLAHAQSDSYKLFRILQDHTENYGGFRDADALSSLSVEGTITQADVLYDFQLRKKRPYSLHYRLSNSQNEITTVYNGTSAWIRKETMGDVTVEGVSVDDLSKIRKFARFESPLFRHIEKRENEITLLEIKAEEGDEIYVIQVEESNAQVYHYYVDGATANILQCDQLDKDGAVSFQTFYRDYKAVDGFPFAHEVENRIGDEVVSLVKIRSINVNTGFLSFFFEKPRI